MQLRPYQQRLIDKTIESIKKGNRRILIQLPTGGGKTAISSEIVKRCYNKGNKSIFCVHRQELLMQTYETYKKNDLSPAFIKSGLSTDVNNRLQIAMINTLANRLDAYKDIDLIIYDECQHQACTTWSKVANHYKNAVTIGLSATPCRLDGKQLNTFFDDMVSEISVKDLIKQGYLVPYKYYAPNELDESDLVLGSNGEYTKDSVDLCVEKSRIIGNNISTYKQLCNGKRNVVFAASCKHGKEVCEQYNKAGIKAEYLDGGISNTERKATLSRFASGETKVLVNVELFSEGFDLPSLEVVSMLRPTHSLSIFLQQVGRGLRICEGKQEAIILDHVNNWKRHGMPDDERIWTLDGKVKTNRENGKSVAIKRCPECFYAHPPALKCPNCGHVYESDGRTIEQVDGQLVLIGSNEEKVLKRQEVIKATTLDDLVIIEKKRGFHPYWAEKQWQLKTGENLWLSLSGMTKIEKARGYSRGWAYARYMRRKGF